MGGATPENYENVDRKLARFLWVIAVYYVYTVVLTFES